MILSIQGGFKNTLHYRSERFATLSTNDTLGVRGYPPKCCGEGGRGVQDNITKCHMGGLKSAQKCSVYNLNGPLLATRTNTRSPTSNFRFCLKRKGSTAKV